MAGPQQGRTERMAQPGARYIAIIPRRIGAMPYSELAPRAFEGLVLNLRAHAGGVDVKLETPPGSGETVARVAGAELGPGGSEVYVTLELMQACSAPVATLTWIVRRLGFASVIEQPAGWRGEGDE